ncbi:MAG: CHAT domain-containing protein [Chitinophagaceae bacterium]|nr:CHAT domain-containing protein [Chitinophagaceae bacterium]
MQGSACWLLLACVLCYHASSGSPEPQQPTVLQLYRKADKLFRLPDPTAYTDKEALATFQLIIDQLESRRGFSDTCLFQSYLKKGILLDIGENYQAAKQAYLRATQVKRLNPAWSDSLLYLPNVYTGSAYYHLNNFDSASYFLQHAEALIRLFPRIQEKERLYNALGALHFENGNYLLSRNYFTLALEVLYKEPASDAFAAIPFENNIAISLFKLGMYREALQIYQKLVARRVFSDQIYLNMGKTLFALREPNKALVNFRKVNPRKVPGLFNEMALAHLELGKVDSAWFFLGQFDRSNNTGYIDRGVNKVYKARTLLAGQQYNQALPLLQEAVILFSGRFTDKDIYANPDNFIGAFASYRLFDALLRKAETLELLYKTDRNPRWLKAALATYNSTMSLSNYIEKSYDTDDAKLLLKKNNRDLYRNALNTCLLLHTLHPRSGYLKQAYLITQRNKASVVLAGLQQRTYKERGGIDPALLRRERNIKYNIARLNLKNELDIDKEILQLNARNKMHFEIELSQVQKNIEKNSTYYKLKYDNTFPSVEAIQQTLKGQQAVISFFEAGNSLHLFVIKSASFSHRQIDSFPLLRQQVQAWVKQLHSSEKGKKFNYSGASVIYELLVKPLQSLAGDKDHWIIVPDGILAFLPFESLPSGKLNLPLLESVEISYALSSQFLIPAASSKVVRSAYSVLAFAPFAGKGESGQQRSLLLQQLPASEVEIATLKGSRYINQAATKTRFIEEANRYPVIHLATHAIYNPQNSAASFVAFYPQGPMPEQDRLYLEELYSLALDSTELMIVSACETGNGELVTGEGVMSLTRGFAYAGCRSVINSLWKADDDATSEILQQFHKYLKDGDTKSKALQKAKLDYLHGDALYKSPDYWSHLVLVGSSEALVEERGISKVMLIVATGLGILLLCYLYLKKKKKSAGLHER